MKNNTKFLVAMLLLFVAFSCSDDDSNGIGNAALLINKWKVVSANNESIDDYFDFEEEIEIIISFDENGKMIMTYITIYDLSETETIYGEWMWEDRYSSLQIMSDGDYVIWRIEKLTNDALWFYDETENAMFKCVAYEGGDFIFDEQNDSPLENENYLIIDNIKYPINMGYNIWFSELDCGNYDIFAHGLYLTSGLYIVKDDSEQTGRMPIPSGNGTIIMFNLFNKSSVLVPGEYVFIDDVNCSGDVTVNGNTFTMGEFDKYVSAVKEMIDPTSYALNVDLQIDLDAVDSENPSDEVIAKYTNYFNSRVGIKRGDVTIDKNNEIYTITFDCIDSNGVKIIGRYKGILNFIEFAI